jgi:hypothetical protein
MPEGTGWMSIVNVEDVDRRGEPEPVGMDGVAGPGVT